MAKLKSKHVYTSIQVKFLLFVNEKWSSLSIMLMMLVYVMVLIPVHSLLCLNILSYASMKRPWRVRYRSYNEYDTTLLITIVLDEKYKYWWPRRMIEKKWIWAQIIRKNKYFTCHFKALFVISLFVIIFHSAENIAIPGSSETYDFL